MKHFEELTERKTTHNKQYNKCGFRVNVETFEIFKYICAGLKMQCNLVPHLSYCHPLATRRRKKSKSPIAKELQILPTHMLTQNLQHICSNMNLTTFEHRLKF